MAAAMALLFNSSSTLPVQVATGVLCASYWRGAWYILDHTLFPDNRALSGIVSLTSGSALLGLKQYIISPSYNGTKRLVRLLPPPESVSLRRRYIQTNRFIVLYGIASGCILIWRGTWLLWDEAAHGIADVIDSRGCGGSTSTHSTTPATSSVSHPPKTTSTSTSTSTSSSAPPPPPPPPPSRPTPIATASATAPAHAHDHHHHGESTLTQHDDIEEKTLFYSGIASHVLATCGLLFMGRFACVMAPPANVTMLRDIFIHGEGKTFARAARKFVSHS
ncbi:hypothetical protein ACHAXA_005029 [Cyclostephanos tholiformis]|uniref:Uncharacterized protein n=1 Tax=Cyclostephanos tholiformis TaxID=382380 RepID=A0ABD3SSQ7_9STRA